MSKSKLVSVRIDESLLADIDKLAEGSEWWKRSNLIEAGLKVIRELAKKKGVSYVCRFCPEFGDVADKLELEYHREHK